MKKETVYWLHTGEMERTAVTESDFYEYLGSVVACLNDSYFIRTEDGDTINSSDVFYASIEIIFNNPKEN